MKTLSLSDIHAKMFHSMSGRRITLRIPDQLHRPSAFDRAKKAGLIGAVKSAPRDLSTNRKHFEGFGRL